MMTMPAAMRIVLVVFVATAADAALAAQEAAQESGAAAKAKPARSFVLRGCLRGSTLSQIEPHDPPIKLPNEVKVTSTRAIRSQVKSLSGHQVELAGALHGVPGVETGFLVGDSDSAKLYLGGGDPNLGHDLVVGEPPTLHANTIKDVAPSCVAGTPKQEKRP
jgi:hypothetical protein